MRHAIRRFPRLWRASRLFRRWYQARHDAYPDWDKILDQGKDLWEAAQTQTQHGPRVLLSTAIGSYVHAVTLESALAAALRLRGAEPHVLLCDAELAACAECDASLYPRVDRFVEHGPRDDLCRDCYWPARRVYERLGVRVHRLSALVTDGQRQTAAAVARSVPLAEIPDYRHDGLAIGEHAYAGALRFFASGSLDDEPRAEAVFRRYLQAALVTMFATRRLAREQGFTCAVFTHGIYIPWGVMGEVCRQEGVRIANWNVAYRKRRFIFSHGDTYHHTLMSEPQAAWETLDLGPAREQTLMNYLASRREGMFDWIVFHRPAARAEPRELASALGLDPSRPIIGLLTNVSWDAQLHYRANAFPDMLDWMTHTCEYFATRPDLQLLIRVHPAELNGFPPSRQPVLAEIAQRLPALAPNITVVPPESRMSTYGLMSLCNAVIIYGTKMGVELTSVGLPVIVAGEAWVRNKGLTRDASTPEEYFRLLDGLPFEERLDETLLRRARKYAYHFFFRRMIPLNFVQPRAGYPIFVLKLDKIERLLPGATPGLDVICDGILTGAPFIYDEGASTPTVTGAAV